MCSTSNAFESTHLIESDLNQLRIRTQVCSIGMLGFHFMTHALFKASEQLPQVLASGIVDIGVRYRHRSRSFAWQGRYGHWCHLKKGIRASQPARPMPSNVGVA